MYHRKLFFRINLNHAKQGVRNDVFNPSKHEPWWLQNDLLTEVSCLTD